MPNLELVPKSGLSSFRRIAIGTWRTAKDPSVYGSMRLRVDEAMRYRDLFRERTGRKLTLTHMMAKAMGIVLSEMPDANAILRFNRIYLRKDVGVFFQVAMTDPETGQLDLSGKTIHGADHKSMVEIYDEFTADVKKVRAGEDEELEGTRSTFKSIPFMALNTFLDVIGFLSYTLNLDLRSMGIPQDPFGSAMVTNVGALGLEAAYVPLVPYSRVPLLIAMGAVQKEPVVQEDDSIGVERVMRIYATFDHRILDGSHAAKMAKIMKRVWHEPFEHFGPIPEAAAEE